MSTQAIRSSDQRPSTADRALDRIVAEIVDGLRHGYFQFSVTCEVIGHGRRRLILHAGKSYQFVIPGEECAPTDRSNTAQDRSDVEACAARGIDNEAPVDTDDA